MSRAFLVADLGYGDSGKGTIVDWLTHTHAADLVVRYNGGPQAGHNVVQPDGRHHTFSQFGSGMFHAGTRTLLAEAMLIEPYAMLNEAAHLRSTCVADPLGRLTIDARCRVIAPPQQVANRIRERSRGPAAHGTCGMGVGETVDDLLVRPDLILSAADLANASVVHRKLRDLTEYKRAELADLVTFALADEKRLFEDLDWIDTAVDIYGNVSRSAMIVQPDVAQAHLQQSRCVVFEGAQGLLLDAHFGFHPHTTWSDVTFRHADTLLTASGYQGPVERIGVTRTYVTRHGAGPMPTERNNLVDALPEPHNTDIGPQGQFRRGPLDLVAIRYALAALGGDVSLAVTHLDRLGALPPIACDAYAIDGILKRTMPSAPTAERFKSIMPIYREWPTHDADAFLDALEEAVSARVTLRSTGLTWRDKSFGRPGSGQ